MLKLIILPLTLLALGACQSFDTFSAGAVEKIEEAKSKGKETLDKVVGAVAETTNRYCALPETPRNFVWATISAHPKSKYDITVTCVAKPPPPVPTN